MIFGADDNLHSDAAAGTLSVLARTREVTGTTTNYVHRLQSLGVATGAEEFCGPAMMTATALV